MLFLVAICDGVSIKRNVLIGKPRVLQPLQALCVLAPAF
jgi:hypothetical protein